MAGKRCESTRHADASRFLTSPDDHRINGGFGGDSHRCWIYPGDLDGSPDPWPNPNPDQLQRPTEADFEKSSNAIVAARRLAFGVWRLAFQPIARW
jgi:hypothetical protein